MGNRRSFRKRRSRVSPATVPGGVTFTADPPPPPPNIYLNGESPISILGQYRQIPAPTRSDLSMVQAEEAYQTGKRFYKEGDKTRARRQFDRAIDLLFEASENPSDRPAFERKFEETVDRINRYDLAGLGSAQNVEGPGFEKSPLEDSLAMT